jgi:hypothetical protein
MERTSVSSSNLVSVGYDADAAVLEVEFKDGSIYRYLNVPQFEYDALMSAPSHGVYFNANIRKSYAYERA